MRMHEDNFIEYHHDVLDDETMSDRAILFNNRMATRRSIRDFSTQEIPKKIIENIILTANNAPSGANKQPWYFCAVSNKDLKHQIRLAAEKEEYVNYHGRMSDAWVEDLKPLGTDWEKPFLTDAPWLIVVFRRAFDTDNEGNIHKNYYVTESVGIACGFLIAAIHHAGLVTVTHTPSPMNFLQKILKRPENEKPFLLLPVGYPAHRALVPNITKKVDESVYGFLE
ncbi:MAG: nitroreductase family protein [Saprospiraceae bacterium]